VKENLDLYLPAGVRRDRSAIAPAVDAFPILGERLHQTAGSLSGGEQQMLAVAKAYLRTPKLIMADELSLGLAPLIIDKIYDSLRELNSQGIGLLIVEQYVHRIREMADEIYILSRNQVVWSGRSDDLDERELVNSYLGEDLLAGR
jgi:branched-chain amino acid transport system ATP-binding protein